MAKRSAHFPEEVEKRVNPQVAYDRRMRPPFVALALLGCTLVTLAGGRATAALPASGVGLPNLVMLPPSEATIDSVVAQGRTRYLLRFTSDVANVGPGPLVLRSSRTSPSAPFTTAQGLRLPGEQQRWLPTTAVVRFSAGPLHDHTHVVGFEAYELRDAAGRILRRDHKLGFCLGDNVPLAQPAPPRRFDGRCGHGRASALVLEQGISAGWKDPYPAASQGQELDVTGLPAGVYLVVNRVNPLRVLRETGYADNVASLKVELSWPHGRSAPPALLGLAVCRSATCP